MKHYTNINNELRTIHSLFEQADIKNNVFITNTTTKINSIAEDFLNSFKEEETDPLHVAKKLIKKYPKLKLENFNKCIGAIIKQNEEKLEDEIITNELNAIDKMLNIINPKTFIQNKINFINDILFLINIQSFSKYSLYLTKKRHKILCDKKQHSNFYANRLWNLEKIKQTLSVKIQFNIIIQDIIDSSSYLLPEIDKLKKSIEIKNLQKQLKGTQKIVRKTQIDNSRLNAQHQRSMRITKSLRRTIMKQDDVSQLLIFRI